MFYTSDNPSLILTVGDGNRMVDIVAMMLPLSPDLLVLVRLRSRTEEGSDRATVLEVGRLNGIQVAANDRFVFSSEELKSADLQKIESMSESHALPNGILAREWWRPNVICNLKPQFDFIKWQ